MQNLQNHSSLEQKASSAVNPASPIQQQTQEIDTFSLALREALLAVYANHTTLPRLFSTKHENIADTFVNLTILHEKTVKDKEKALGQKEKQEADGKKDSFQDKRLYSHEQLYQAHEVIKLEDLFTSAMAKAGHQDQGLIEAPKKLVINGRAGIGKSVLCQYLATQGMLGKLENFKRFKTIFWLSLRKLADRLKGHNIQDKASMVAEIISLCCLTDNTWQTKKKKKKLTTWLKAHADETLFIVDGLDEVASLLSEAPLLHDCLVSLLNQTDYRPYILLTTRPISIPTDFGAFSYRLECMGFTDDNIPAFVQRYFAPTQTKAKKAKVQEKIKNCLAFLKKQPSIWGIAHIPLTLELVCWLWAKAKGNQTEDLSTLSALYRKIIAEIQRVQLEKRKQSGALLNTLCTYQQDGQQQPVRVMLATLAQDFLALLAFRAMQQAEVLLSGQLIEQCSADFIKKTQVRQEGELTLNPETILQACLDLGLLKTTQSGGKQLIHQTCYFIHLSFQEYFAAIYYAQYFAQPEVANTQVIIHFREHKYSPRYQLTWWLTAGLLYEAWRQEKSEKTEEGLNYFFETLTTEPLDWVGIHHFNLLSHCLDECRADCTVPIILTWVEHQAQFLELCLKKNWLVKSWGKTLTQQCRHLVTAAPWQAKAEAIDANQVLLWHIFPKNKHYISDVETKAALLGQSLSAPRLQEVLTQEVLQLKMRLRIAKACVQIHGPLSQALWATVVSLYKQSKAYDLDASAHTFFIEQAGALGQEALLWSWLADETLDSSVRGRLAKSLAQKPDLNEGQLKHLWTLLAGKTPDFGVREGLVLGLAQRSDLNGAQLVQLCAVLADETLDSSVRGRLAKSLAQRSDLNEARLTQLYAWLADKTLDRGVRIRLAKSLAQRSDLNEAQLIQWYAWLADKTLDRGVRDELAESLAQRVDLNEAQLTQLCAWLADKTLVCRGLALGLAPRSDLNEAQSAQLCAGLADRTPRRWARAVLAWGLAQRADLNEAQLTQLCAELADETLHSGLRGVPGQLVECLAKNSAFKRFLPQDANGQLISQALQPLLIRWRWLGNKYILGLLWLNNPSLITHALAPYVNQTEFLKACYGLLLEEQALLAPTLSTKEAILYCQGQAIKIALTANPFSGKIKKYWGLSPFQLPLLTRAKHSAAATVKSLEAILSLSPKNPSVHNVQEPYVNADSRKSSSQTEVVVSKLPVVAFSAHIAYEQLKFIEKLGAGGFGEVWECRYQQYTVAIKKLNLSTTLGEKDQDSSTRKEKVNLFWHEFNIMASLNSLHIIRFYGACIDEKEHCYALVMEYMVNGSLLDVLRIKPAPSIIIRYQIALDISHGLKYLHQEEGPTKKAIIHGDVKSENILIDRDYRARISDFGLSKLGAEGNGSGTKGWLAPELYDEKVPDKIKAGAKSTQATDVYSYGLVLSHLFTLKVPALPQQPTKEEIVQATSSTMAKLMSRCWQKEASKRPSMVEAVESAQQAVAEAEEAAKHQDIASEDFKQKITEFLAQAQAQHVSFKLSRPNPNQLIIQLQGEKVNTQDAALKDSLKSLQKGLKLSLDKIRIPRSDYESEPLLDEGKLIIRAKDITILNRIGAVLKNAGQNYWNPAQIAYCDVFFKPVVEDKKLTQANPTPKEDNEITCNLQ